jgi:hypothetical protein
MVPRVDSLYTKQREGKEKKTLISDLNLYWKEFEAFSFYKRNSQQEFFHTKLSERSAALD